MAARSQPLTEPPLSRTGLDLWGKWHHTLASSSPLDEDGIFIFRLFLTHSPFPAEEDMWPMWTSHYHAKELKSVTQEWNHVEAEALRITCARFREESRATAAIKCCDGISLKLGMNREQ